MSLAPKMNEVSDVITTSFFGHCLHNRDLVARPHLHSILEDLHDEKIEAIWLHLPPSCLPRGLSCIIIANVYHPQTDKGVSDSDSLLYLPFGLPLS